MDTDLKQLAREMRQVAQLHPTPFDQMVPELCGRSVIYQGVEYFVILSLAIMPEERQAWMLSVTNPNGSSIDDHGLTVLRDALIQHAIQWVEVTVPTKEMTRKVSGVDLGEFRQIVIPINFHFPPQANPQWHEYSDNCPGCQPTLADPKTMQSIPSTHPAMQNILAIWKTLPLATKKACNRVWVRNSRDPQDLQLMNEVTQMLEATGQMKN